MADPHVMIRRACDEGKPVATGPADSPQTAIFLEIAGRVRKAAEDTADTADSADPGLLARFRRTLGGKE